MKSTGFERGARFGVVTGLGLILAACGGNDGANNGPGRIPPASGYGQYGQSGSPYPSFPPYNPAAPVQQPAPGYGEQAGAPPSYSPYGAPPAGDGYQPQWVNGGQGSEAAPYQSAPQPSYPQPGYPQAEGYPAPAHPPAAGYPPPGSAGTGDSNFRANDRTAYDAVGYAEGVGGGYGGGADSGCNPSGVFAVHASLGPGSYVEVTALDSGRTVLVCISGPGYLSNGRLIGLSPLAMEQLGLTGSRMPVRVRKVNPPEQEKATLRNGGKAAERMQTPPALLSVLRNRLGGQAGTSSATVPVTSPSARPSAAPRPAPNRAPGDPFIVEQSGTRAPARPSPRPAAVAPAPVRGGYIVQVGAFSSRDKAIAVARKLGGGVSQIGSLWRVRTGPYASEGAARQGANRAVQAGFSTAKVMLND